MNQEERDWLEWLKRVRDGVVTQRQAAEKMGVSDRWVRKLLVRMKTDGDAVVVHGLRGRSSNRRIDEQTQARAIELLKQPEWHDFGPTFASEQLAKRHNIHVSKETVRAWMMAAGLWKAQPRKLGEKHFWRPRRSGYGELVQWDTSNHDWLEGRGEPVRYLVRMIDDATSRSGGRFVQHDGTRENMGVLWEYVERQRADGGRLHGPGLDVRGGATGQGKRAAAAGGGSPDAVRPRRCGSWESAGSRRTRRRPRGAWSEASGPIRTGW